MAPLAEAVEQVQQENAEAKALLAKLLASTLQDRKTIESQAQLLQAQTARIDGLTKLEDQAQTDALQTKQIEDL